MSALKDYLTQLQEKQNITKSQVAELWMEVEAALRETKADLESLGIEVKFGNSSVGTVDLVNPMGDRSVDFYLKEDRVSITFYEDYHRNQVGFTEYYRGNAEKILKPVFNYLLTGCGSGITHYTY